MNKHYRKAREAAAEMNYEMIKIRKIIKHAHLRPLDVHLALDVPFTLQGVIVRFCARHGSYLRYIESTRTWQFYNQNTKTQVAEWFVVEPHRVEKLLVQLIEKIKDEAKIVNAAVLTGVISEKPEGYTRSQTIFIDSLKNNFTQIKLLVDQLKAELSYNGIYIAPEKSAFNTKTALIPQE